MSWQILFQQIAMRIFRRLCNNSEIDLWLWKLRNLVVCSQSFFCATRARKDDKNRQKTLFLCKKKMNSVPNEQFLPNIPFQSTKYKKKEFCVDKKVQETIEDVYCPTCRNEKCVQIWTNKTTSFYDCRKCEACCHFLNIPFFGPETDNYVAWRWWYTLFCKKDESRLRKRKTIHIFDAVFPPITTQHIQTWTKKGIRYSIYG